jgi:hypothetical protein
MSAADDLFERMSRSKSGWGQRDLETLYLGFGFRKREGRKHCVYSHPRHPALRATVARSKELPVGYIQTALSLIRQLRSLETRQGAQSDDKA